MLTVQNIKKSFGIDPVLSDISFTLNPGERMGLVGTNGCGKTTLLRILSGLEKADGGVVRFSPAAVRVGYLPQGLAFQAEDTLETFLHRMEGDLEGLSARLGELAVELVNQPGNRVLQDEYDQILAQLEAASEAVGRGPVILAGLGLDSVPRDLPVRALSGGQKTRLALAGVLVSRPQLLLLDEPTNHLDLEMLDWLEEWLAHFDGAVLVVSHDRAFLDAVATSILEIDHLTHTGRVYEGNYTAFVEQKAAERERQRQAYQDQQAEIVRLRGAVAAMRDKARFRKGGKADPANTDGFSVGFFANRSKEVVQKAKNIEKRIERLMTVDRVDKPSRSWEMKMEFAETPSSGRDVLVLEHLDVGYGDTVLLRDLNLTLRFGARTALVGPNGCGKTSLIRTILGQNDPLGGQVRLGSNVQVGYMAQEQENLDPAFNVFETICRIASLSETDARAFLSFYLFKGDDVFTPVGLLSYGERARLTLACLVAQGCNFLVLDEPVNHLDIPSRSRFEHALANFPGSVLAVVHDRYFISSFASELWQVCGQTIQTVELDLAGVGA